jgi:hypothetical protein
VWYLKKQTWTVVGAPSNARITEGISGWERVSDKIIEAKGCIVPDENFRTGRHARKIHEEGRRKTKLQRKRDCKGAHLLPSRCTPLSWGPTRSSWSPRGADVLAERTE